MSDQNDLPSWVVRGKTISELIEELETFSDKSLKVLISTDDGVTRKPISLVMKSEGTCMLVNYENTHLKISAQKEKAKKKASKGSN